MKHRVPLTSTAWGNVSQGVQSSREKLKGPNPAVRQLPGGVMCHWTCAEGAWKTVTSIFYMVLILLGKTGIISPRKFTFHSPQFTKFPKKKLNHDIICQ